MANLRGAEGNLFMRYTTVWKAWSQKERGREAWLRRERPNSTKENFNKKDDEHVLCPRFRKQKTQQKFSAQVISLYNMHMELINNSLHMLKSFSTSGFFM